MKRSSRAKQSGDAIDSLLEKFREVNRGLTILLAVIGGAAAALLAVMVVGGALLGILWIFVFGDDPWPHWSEVALNIAIPLVGLLLWAAFGWQIWLRLKRLAQ